MLISLVSGVGVDEFKLSVVPGYASSYYIYASQKSSAVYLHINQRLHLRVRYINVNTAGRWVCPLKHESFSCVNFRKLYVNFPHDISVCQVCVCEFCCS